MCRGSRPYPSNNAKRQFDVICLTRPSTYYNVKRCYLLHLEKVYMLLQYTVKGLLFKPTLPSIWKAPLKLFRTKSELNQLKLF